MQVNTAAQDSFYSLVVEDGADPWVYKHTDGYYYFTKTTGNNITIWKSERLSTIGSGRSCMIQPEGCNLWAPELHYIAGAWYIYYARDDGDNANHRMYVLENRSPDPFAGSWEDKGQITDASNKWAIDGTVLQLNKQLYFLWSGWEGDENIRQNLYIAAMQNPWTIASPRVELARPTYAWETNHHPHVNEGPQLLIRNGQIHLVYSASGSWTDDYCLGLITASEASDLLNPASWTKQSQPIFQAGNGLYGPGHASFTVSPDGTEEWIVYHTAKHEGAGWKREIRMQRFSWHDDGTPKLGAPVAADQAMPLPSGEQALLRN